MDIKQIISRLRDSKLFKDSTWALIGSILGKGLSLMAGIVVARFLGKEIYGEYGMIKNTLFQIAVFSTLGLGYTGTRFISKYLNSEKEHVGMYIRIIYNITFMMSGLLALLTFIFSKQIAIFLEVPENALAFKFTALIIIANAVNTAQVGILSGYKDFKVIAKNNTLGGIMTFVSSVGLTYIWGLYGALIALLVSMIFNAVINSLSIGKKTKELPSFQSNKAIKYKEFISFSIPIALQESLYSVVAWSISVMMIKFSTYGELGLLQAANQWGNIVLFIPGVLKNVILSHFSSTSDVLLLRKRMILTNFFATFIPMVGVFMFSRFISSFYGPSFNGLPVVMVFACMAAVPSSIAGVVLYELISAGRTWLSFLFRILRDVANLVLIFIILKFHFLGSHASQNIVVVQFVINTFFAIILVLLIKKNHSFLKL